MYEDMTFENILNRMLSRVPDNVDKREGSIIYDALAPAAAELAVAYIQLDVTLNESFADTASREYLIKRAAERGVNPYPATNAVLKGVFKDSQNNPFDVPIGSRYSLDDTNYKVIEKIADGEYKLQCESTGVIGNQKFGTLIPIEYIPGLSTAKLVELLVPGENEEDTESLRQRYFNSLKSEAYGGNITDYIQKTNAIQGVGGTKVYPVWNGGGTVKLVIIDSEYNSPTEEMIDEVQTIIDPVSNNGEGVGIAPIGHKVTVVGVTEVPISISTNIIFQDGLTWEDVKELAKEKIEEYFKELRSTWADQEALVVRISQIEVRLLNVPGILDAFDTIINGTATNLVLGADEIPVLDVITV